MKVPFTWRPTGWFMIGWSAQFPTGAPQPMKYLGQDLVGYRGDDGAIHVLDAHCAHLGAHLGHGGTVVGDCITCPYHGWVWAPDGTNRDIPYEDGPRKKRIRSWPVREQHECVFLWHDPAGGPPRWELPDLFSLHEPAKPEDYYRPYPELSIKYEREPVHPQIPLENGPDSIHFKYVHGASVDPYLVDYTIDAHEWRHTAGWPHPDGDDRLALRLHSILPGVGGSFVVFEGATSYRLIFHTTPVDDETSDMFYSIWWPREPGDESDVPPEAVQQRVAKEFLSTLEDDLKIWRYQVYVERPAFTKRDARPYADIRKWARQFYELEPSS